MMPEDKKPYYEKAYDLQNCEQEPIQKIRRTQNYGGLLVCDLQGKKWFYVSDIYQAALEASNPFSFIQEKTGIDLSTHIFSKSIEYLANSGFDMAAIVHKKEDQLIIEIEPNDGHTEIKISDQDFQNVILNLSGQFTEQEYYHKIIDEVYQITNYDHIMIYKFDDEYNGQVVAEKKLDQLNAYLGMKFPASDVPKQARDLYFKEKVRIVFDSTKPQTYISKNKDIADLAELSLEGVSIRGVSPIHMEYLNNMGVSASFSVAITKDDRLWGLIACHNCQPRFINFKTRSWLSFLSSLISKNLEKLVNNKEAFEKVEKKLTKSLIIEKILTSKDLISSLLDSQNSVLELFPSDGVIIRSKGVIKSKGELPEISQLEKLDAWLNDLDEFDAKAFASTKEILPEEIYDPSLAGMLILQISQLTGDVIIWTRKEQKIDVIWAGDPNNTKSFNLNKGRLTPRKSFDKWKETVTDRSISWKEEEINIALKLKEELREHLYEKYNEIMLLNKELKRAYAEMESFSYSVSHDLKAPLRSIEGFSEMLKSEYAKTLDGNGLHLLNTITDSITNMKSFIHEILNFSKLNRTNLDIREININEIVRKEWNSLTAHDNVKAILIFDYNIPSVFGDHNMIAQIVRNILSNSLKYVARGINPRIEIWFESKEDFINVFVEDNGIGIPEMQRNKVFEVFSRLVNSEDYEGTGVGMSIVKKAIQRHGGEILILDPIKTESGTLFSFTLPSNQNYKQIIEKRNQD
jgi:light-regulated signal transduction histidine kinase (bacteriophytochrome)